MLRFDTSRITESGHLNVRSEVLDNRTKAITCTVHGPYYVNSSTVSATSCRVGNYGVSDNCDMLPPIHCCLTAPQLSACPRSARTGFAV